MKKEEVMVLAQLMTAMKDSIGELEKAQNAGEIDKVMIIKKELLNFQKKIDEML